MIHPEFPRRITAEVWEAVYQRILSDERYQRLFGEILKADVEDAVFAGTFTPPVCAVTLGPIDLDPMASGRSNQTSILDVVLIWPIEARSDDTNDDLRARVLDDLRVLLTPALQNEAGEWITEALTRFQRFESGVWSAEFLLDRLRVVYQSYLTAELMFEG